MWALQSTSHTQAYYGCSVFNQNLLVLINVLNVSKLQSVFFKLSNWFHNYRCTYLFTSIYLFTYHNYLKRLKMNQQYLQSLCSLRVML